MKRFEQRELRAAYAHAVTGGQALHVCDAKAFVRDDSPNCFKQSPQFAHLFDQDHPRLVRTARRFGVRVIKVEHPGTERQHIDLCGRPLARAIAQCIADANDAAVAAEGARQTSLSFQP